MKLFVVVLEEVSGCNFMGQDFTKTITPLRHQLLRLNQTQLKAQVAVLAAKTRVHVENHNFLWNVLLLAQLRPTI